MLAISLLGLSLIIVVHELGHFIACHCCGVDVDVFAIGLGRTLYQRQTKVGTQFKINWIPLGGYIIPHGQNKASAINTARSYLHQAAYKRMLIVLGGPIINFLAAILIYSVLFLIGIPSLKPIIQNIQPNTPAAHARLQAGDTIISANHRAIHSWHDLILPFIQFYGNDNPLPLSIKRQSHTTPLSIKLNLSQLPATPNKNFWLTLGIPPPKPTTTLTVAKILPSSKAAAIGLRQNDRITSINKQPLQTWQQLKTQLNQQVGKTISLGYQRQNQLHRIQFRLPNTQPPLGIMMQSRWPSALTTLIKHPLHSTLGYAIKQTFNTLKLTWFFFTKLLTGQLSIRLLSGPIGIANAGSHALSQGLINYFYYLAYINVAIGFFNLLPIPGLDGGHLLLQIVEIARRKKHSDQFEKIWLFSGFLLIGLLIIFVTTQDLIRLLT